MTRFAIVTERGCASFILCRRHEYEAFDVDDISLGLCETEGGPANGCGGLMIVDEAVDNPNH